MIQGWASRLSGSPAPPRPVPSTARCKESSPNHFSIADWHHCPIAPRHLQQTARWMGATPLLSTVFGSAVLHQGTDHIGLILLIRSARCGSEVTRIVNRLGTAAVRGRYIRTAREQLSPFPEDRQSTRYGELCRQPTHCE